MKDDFDIPEVFRRAMEEAGWQADEDEGGGGRGRPRQPFPPPSRPSRFNRWIVIGVVLLILFFALGSIATFYTDWLWFDHLGFRNLFVTRLSVRLIVFAVGFALAAGVLLANWLIARRQAARQAGQAAQWMNSRAITWLIVAGALFLAFLFGSAAASQWEELLLLLNAVPFGVADPIFNRDVSFYVFQLPILEFVQGWLVTLILLALLGIVPLYALPNLPEIQRGAWKPFSYSTFRRHLLALGGVILLIWAGGYILDMYRLLFSPRGVAYGASYTDLTVGLWALRLQLVTMILAAAALFYNIFRPSLRLLAGTVGLWLLSTFVIAGLLPGVIQRYVVEPNELSLETPYIQTNIDFTRQAFALDRIEELPFGSVTSLSTEDVLQNEDVLRNIRLWDYRPLQQTYQQLQALRPYYHFNEVDIDRYEIDGQQRQVMLAARELDKGQLPAPSWVNRNLEFTHGYGVVMNPVDEVTREGQPQFYIKDFPPQSTVPIEITRPEIYFGELTDDTVYVGSAREEFSYPSGDENVYTFYEGQGGILMNSFDKRLAFALRQSDPNVLLSNDITNTTRVQFRRQIQDRVRELTPFLMLDGDPYLVITDDGRLVWMQDAYTVSSNYPYSTPISVAMRSSANVEGGTAQPGQVVVRNVNYMRNSVKVTIDAYDGLVNYYISDPTDPIIQSYSGAFPGVFQPLDAMPENLQNHIRYPVDFFWVQARQYLTYHMTDPRIFYNKEDLWQIPNEIYDEAQQPIEPYYVTLPLPGSQESEYLLILPFTPATKTNMIAWMAARNDPENYGELVVYEMPKQELIFGPLQVEGRIDQEPTISEQFTLWDQRGSNVIRGNLLVLPINQSFLYVEPVYLISENNALPELRRIVTATNQSVAMAETLPTSLQALRFDEVVVPVAAEVPPAEVDADVSPPVTPEGESAQPVPVPVPADATVEQLVQSANGHLLAADEAQRAGDWARYGQELEALRQNLEQLSILTGTE